MKHQLFNKDVFKLLQSGIRERYQQMVFHIETSALGLQGTEKHLAQYHPLKYFWLTNVEIYNEIEEVTQECPHRTTDTLTEDEETIFEVWESGEYGKEFLDFIKDHSIREGSEYTLALFKKQLIYFYQLHISQELAEAPDDYRCEFDIGDYPIGDKIITSHQAMVLPAGTVLYNWDQQNEQRHIARITRSLKIIKEASPSSYDRFEAFTQYLIPVNDDGIVSYSSQDLPGYSTINLYNRDDVDLLDDLLHENGHHHLNYYLNLGELIVEDDEQIYYSPWRKALRPIRGIYHATFTFFWALQLFFDLSKFERREEYFNPEQIQKIYRRAIEEYLMLDYCRQDLILARENNKILDEGQTLILEIFHYLDDYQAHIDQLRGKLSSENIKQVEELELSLKDKREHYQVL
jgi:hypothetical protein